MKKIKKVNAVSIGKVAGSIYGFFGLIAGAFITLVSLLGVSLSKSGSGMMAIFGVASIILLPLFYGILGFIGGLIGGWLYNLGAKWTGGIQVEIE